MSSRSVSSALGGKLGVLLLLLVTVASRAEDNLGEKDLFRGSTAFR